MEGSMTRPRVAHGLGSNEIRITGKTWGGKQGTLSPEGPTSEHCDNEHDFMVAGFMESVLITDYHLTNTSH